MWSSGSNFNLKCCANFCPCQAPRFYSLVKFHSICIKNCLTRKRMICTIFWKFSVRFSVSKAYLLLLFQFERLTLDLPKNVRGWGYLTKFESRQRSLLLAPWVWKHHWVVKSKYHISLSPIFYHLGKKKQFTFLKSAQGLSFT